MADACGIAEAVRTGRLSAEQVTAAALERARTVGRQLNCYTAVLDEDALREARDIDARRRRDATLSPLAGVPIAVKNLFDIAGVVTLAGSKIDRRKPAAGRDAAALKRLRDADAVLIGALGMDEYAYGFTNENTHYGPVRNPHDPARVAGGSSGGSGAAVAGRCVPLALGTDTNGSIRVPASLCGTFGLKPTFGRISRAGVTPFTPSLDHVGCLALSARDCALAFDVMHGHDADDPVSSGRPREAVFPTLDRGISDLRIAVATGYFREQATGDAIDAADAVAHALGARLEVDIPEAGTARHAAMILSAVEGSALHFQDLQTRPEEFDPMTRDRFIAGALLPGEAYVRAQAFRHAYKTAVAQIFAGVDVLITPATPMVAPRIGQTEIEIDGSKLPARAHLGRFTAPISFIGLPAMAVPVRTSSRLPIGVQLIGAPYGEGALLRAAHYLEMSGSVAAPLPSMTPVTEPLEAQ
jgi:AtzE family amidohydrolase